MGEKTDTEQEMMKRFRYARAYKKPLIDEMVEDFEFAAGDQWDDDDVQALRNAGVIALTINKIAPNIFLLSGMERQNRTDFRAYPEGEEDSLKSEIATRLLKNAMKRSNGEYKMSEAYEDGITGGEGDIQFSLDYTNDLINGEMRLKKVSPFKVFVDPDSIEYDLSDAEYIFKLTTKLTEDQVVSLYPEKESKIRAIENGEIYVDDIVTVTSDGDYRDNPDFNSNILGIDDLNERSYDLLEMEYRKYVTKYLVVDLELGSYKMIDSKKEADAYADNINGRSGEETVKVIKRTVPEIWVRVMVGDTEIDDYRSPLYPRWKAFSIIPFYAHRYTTPIKATEYMLQGIVRAMKPLQIEVNKRRTQALRHVNTSTNSGWKVHKGAKVDKNKLKKYGATPSYVLEWEGNVEPTQIFPQPLSQALEYMSKQSAEDMKKVSGVDTDLLAQESSSQSGRAIFLKQQQGVVMVQRILDNFQHTKKLVGRLVLSQLGEMYSVETAVKVLGEAFIKDSFSVPAHEVAEKVMQKRQQNPDYQPTQEEAKAILKVQEWTQSGQQVPVLTKDGQLEMAVDKDAAGAVINMILMDEDLTKYDVSVGEAQSSETIKLANYSMLLDFAEKGIPIPPEIIINESLLSPESKNQIKSAIDAQRKAIAEGQK